MTSGLARYIKQRMRTEAVLEEVKKERISQDNKWGVQNHEPFKWLSILGEEVGESFKEANDAHMWHDQGDHLRWTDKGLAAYRAELLQVAAVAVAMVECLDRGEWHAKDNSSTPEK